MSMSRREFLRYAALAGVSVALPGPLLWADGELDNVLDPLTIPKYVAPLIMVPVMPRSSVVRNRDRQIVDYYDIGIRQISQQILPPNFPATTVWAYGSRSHRNTFHSPGFTIEAKYQRPVRVNWVNELTDSRNNFLPHLLPVDQTLHWANPPGGEMGRDMETTNPDPYLGPVPIITHLHGGKTDQQSDGYPEAWYLPNARNIPAGYARDGTYYEPYKAMFAAQTGRAWRRGAAVFEYGNDQRATTLWYHDHALGMTRLNVYAGLAAFYLLRGGPSDEVVGLPGPPPYPNQPAGTRNYEIPIAIQDRTFNQNASLFFPNNRAYFEGLEVNQLQIPFIPETACDGLPSDISAIYNPEFFGNTMMVNGNTWPVLQAEPRRYRLRLLDGCNARTLILKIVSESNLMVRPAPPEVPFWQIGSEGGFLAAPIELPQLLIAPAERPDVIIDLTGFPVGTVLYLINEGPDSPYNGQVGTPDSPYADPQTTGQVMKIVIVPLTAPDTSLPPNQLVLPPLTPIGPAVVARQLSLNELDSESIRVVEEVPGDIIVLACNDPNAEDFGPAQTRLGTLVNGQPVPMKWSDPVTENPQLGVVEMWEFYNFTADAHPIHLHETQFQVVNRQSMSTPATRGPEPWETGYKDTVIAYPGEITRIKMSFDKQGRYVWHCHIIDHEDNEMMRPMQIGPPPTSA